jgi:hypothetical protein
MSIELHLEGARSGALRGIGAGVRGRRVVTARSRSPHVTPETRPDALDLDPLAGEDEPWADEDFLRAPDREDYLGFLRTLWLAIVFCVLFWLALAVAGVQLFRFVAG